jgi:prevent-host-death family protein
MELSLTQDILSVSEFKKRIKDTFDQVHRTGRPVVLTVNGKADAVLVDAGAYERQVRELNFLRLAVDGEADIAVGRTRPLRRVMSDLKRKFSGA